MKLSNFIFALFAIIGMLFTSCENTNDILRPSGTNGENSFEERELSGTPPLLDEGAVYTMTNDAVDNEIVVFYRNTQGQLRYSGRYLTKGQGSGNDAFDPLASQGSIVISDDYSPNPLPGDRRWLCAVNAGSDQISVFAVNGDELDLRGVAFSGGRMPVSLTVRKDLLYVLNRSVNSSEPQNNSASIVGFGIGEDGRLEKIDGSLRLLDISDAAQIQFCPESEMLVVTGKNTNSIVVCLVGEDGLVSEVITHESAGPTPFGFAFDCRQGLIVSEAFNHMPNQGAASLYQIGPNGSLEVMSPCVPTYQSSSRRAVATRGMPYAYIANTHSGSISGFKITEQGELKPIDDKIIVAQMGENSFPVDMAVIASDRFLYILDPGRRTIHQFQVLEDGHLESLWSAGRPVNLSAFAGIEGLAAY